MMGEVAEAALAMRRPEGAQIPDGVFRSTRRARADLCADRDAHLVVGLRHHLLRAQRVHAGRSRTGAAVLGSHLFSDVAEAAEAIPAAAQRLAAAAGFGPDGPHALSPVSELCGDR